MAYEFIAAGIRPAMPGTAFIEARDRAIERNELSAARAVNLEASTLALDEAKKQVTAEKVAGQLPRDQAGMIDFKSPEFQAYTQQFPTQADNYRKDAFKTQIDQFALMKGKLDAGAAIFGNVHTPEQLAEAQQFAKDNLGLEFKNPETFFHMSTAASQLGQEIETQVSDVSRLVAAGKFAEAELLMSSINAQGNQAAAAAALVEAQTDAARARAEASRAAASLSLTKAASPGTTQPLVQFLDEQGNAVWGTREQAVGMRPVPPAASLRDEIARDKITEAKSRVSGNLDALDEAYNELSALGGAIDTGKSPSENVSAAMRSSAPGQLVGRALGTKEQSERNKIVQMRPLLLQEIRQASAMGARGLDSNKELDFYLAAATDPTRDLQANKAAMNVLSQAYGLGKTYGEVDPNTLLDLNNEFLGDIPLVRSQEEYEALKPGTEYRSVDGSRHRKKK